MVVVEYPKTGSEARKLGVPKYFTGRPCIRGHVTPRYAHNGQCNGCAAEISKSRTGTPEREAYQRRYYVKKRSTEPETIMLATAKERAKKAGVPCTVTKADILAAFPKDGFCPAIGLKLERNFDTSGSYSPASPSLDRLIPELGYIPGNIAVISMHANRLKNNETDPEVFRRLANWIEG